MDGEELMEHSPEQVSSQNIEGEPFELDGALFPDKSPSSGPQSDYGYDEQCPKSQESMITDGQNIEVNQHEASCESESESDSEESPESPPPQPSSPMEQEFPVINEDEAMNIRSPDVSLKVDADVQSGQEDNEEHITEEREESHDAYSPSMDVPDNLGQEECKDDGNVSDLPEAVFSSRGKDQSENDIESEDYTRSVSSSNISEVKHVDNIASPELPAIQAVDVNVADSGSVCREITEMSDSVDSLDIINPVDSSVNQLHGGTLNVSIESDSEQLVDSTGDRLVRDVIPIKSPSFSRKDDNFDGIPDAEEESEGECEDSEEDMYSLDLMKDDTEDKTCDPVGEGLREERDSRGNIIDSRFLGVDNSFTQDDPDSKVSRTVEPQNLSNIDAPAAHFQRSISSSSPKYMSDDQKLSHSARNREVSQSSDSESYVHSTSDSLSKCNNKSSVHKEGADCSGIVNDSGDNFEPTDIPNGHDGSPSSSRDADVKAGKVQQNTSFNEEHVELDYDEEDGEEDKEHGNNEEKHKTGSDAEKCDGEITGSDEEEDDGELDDDEDCEEGEIREPGSRKPFTKPVCRFYLKGSCTWGNNCRFIHPGVNDKGNYRLIDPPNYNGGMGIRGRLGTPWGQEPAPEQELPPPPPPPPELPATESAWERGLRHAKEMRKKANMRKEQETNFEEKRMNLSLDEERELNKENERSKYVKDPYYDQYDDDEYYGKAAVHGWHPGSYENFEIRWTREQEYSPYRHEKERERFKEHRYSPGLERIERLERQMYDQPPRTRDERRDKYREERMVPPPPSQGPRGRADEWHDPWQRSKSPKQKKRSSRSHSRGRRRRRSYSVSSHSSSSYSSSRSRSSSFSSRSSRSSYSRSSSGSSRSPSPRPHAARKNVPAPMEKRAPPPSKAVTGKKGPPPDERKVPSSPKNNEQPRSAVTVRSKQRSPDKRASGPPGPGKPSRAPPAGERGRHLDKLPHPPRANLRKGSRSSSGSSLSRSRSRSSSSSSRSRSASSGSSRSRSSSTSSSGSADSEHLYRDLPGANRPTSPKKKGPVKEKRLEKGPPKQSKAPPRRRDVDQGRERRDDRVARQDSRSGLRGKGPPGRQPTTPVKAKDPLKLVGQKSNIKLTLLNKPTEKSGLIPGAPPVKRRMSDNIGGPPAKRPSGGPPPVKPSPAEKSKAVMRPEKLKSPPPTREKPAMQQPKPVSKTVPASKPSGPGKAAAGVPPNIPPPPSSIAKPKKSTTSRREELLKQLKAVEDAIARKKSKMQ